jgi:hypothetical protein
LIKNIILPPFTGWIKQIANFMQYLEYFDEAAYEGTWNSEMEHFMSEISTINRSYRMLGIEASDLRPENLGRDKDGNLKAFDIEDRRKEKYRR